VCDSSGYWTPEEAVGKVPWVLGFLIYTLLATKNGDEGKELKKWHDEEQALSFSLSLLLVCVCVCVCFLDISRPLERLPGTSACQMSHMCLRWRPSYCDEQRSTYNEEG
jgi:hypothetical protein